MIELKKITTNNIGELLELKVADEQKNFIDAGGNRDALAYAYAWSLDGVPHKAYGIFANEEAVGLVIYLYESIDYEEDEFKALPFYGENVYFVDYLMIDEKYQGKGFGNQAIAMLLEEIKTKPLGNAGYVVIRYDSANTAAGELYDKHGFSEKMYYKDSTLDAYYAYKNI